MTSTAVALTDPDPTPAKLRPVQVVPAEVPSVFSSDAAGVDRLQRGDAASLLAEVAAHPQAETPVVVGVFGPAGSGKTQFLRQITARLAPLAGAADAGTQSPAPVEIVTVTVEAGAGRDPIAALTSGVLAALGVRHPGLAEDAIYAASDPREAARLAEERVDALRRTLDAERQGLDDLAARRARLAETVLFDAAGSRVDTYARGHRARIEARLRCVRPADVGCDANLQAARAGNRRGVRPGFADQDDAALALGLRGTRQAPGRGHPSRRGRRRREFRCREPGHARGLARLVRRSLRRTGRLGALPPRLASAAEPGGVCAGRPCGAGPGGAGDPFSRTHPARRHPAQRRSRGAASRPRRAFGPSDPACRHSRGRGRGSGTQCRGYGTTGGGSPRCRHFRPQRRPGRRTLRCRQHQRRGGDSLFRRPVVRHGAAPRAALGQPREGCCRPRPHRRGGRPSRPPARAGRRGLSADRPSPSRPAALRDDPGNGARPNLFRLGRRRPCPRVITPRSRGSAVLRPRSRLPQPGKPGGSHARAAEARCGVRLRTSFGRRSTGRFNPSRSSS